MKCPQCGSTNRDDEWNCVVCRVNLYWAVQHFERLADIREQAGLPATPASPAFLIEAHKHAMAERAERGATGESAVRDVARKVIRRKAEATEPSSHD